MDCAIRQAGSSEWRGVCLAIIMLIFSTLLIGRGFVVVGGNVARSGLPVILLLTLTLTLVILLITGVRG